MAIVVIAQLMTCLLWTAVAQKLQEHGDVVLRKKVGNLGNENVCRKLKLNMLFAYKRSMEEKLLSNAIETEKDETLDPKTKLHRSKAIKIFQREINDTVDTLMKSVSSLKSILKGNFRSILALKKASEARLDLLRQAMVTAEDEYNEIIEEEKEEVADEQLKVAQKSGGVIKKYVDKLMGEIAVAANDLEEKLDDDYFEKQLHDKQKKHVNIETVIRVADDHEADDDSSNEGVIMLVDSHSNHFVLSKPTDSTITHVDHLLLKEIMVTVLVSFVFGLLGVLMQLPSMFSSIIAGVVLGPSGSGYLTSIVQLETIGEFGVFFMLFEVGLEFSPGKFKKIWWPSVIGNSSIIFLHTALGLFWGNVFGIRPQQSIFVALCLTFSSTPVVTKLLGGQDGKDHSESSEDYSSLLLAMLILQDIVLGIFMAILPIMAGHSSERGHSFAIVPKHDWFHGALSGAGEELFWTLFELTFAICGIAFFSYVMAKYLAARFFRSLNQYGSHDLFTMGILSLIFLLAMMTDSAGVSLELGTFICGVIIGTMGEKIVLQVRTIVEPFKDLFSCLFFASIGFHVFPTFVLSEMAFFIPLTLLVVITKFCVSVSVLHQLLPKGDISKWLVSAGLAQLSEFSFVLGSRARRFGLISREIYLSILSITTLSLLISPVMWRSVRMSVLGPRKWNWRCSQEQLLELLPW